MVTLAWPTLEQRIRLDAVAIDGRLEATRLATTRASGIAGTLTSRPVEQVPQISSQLFPLCGTAHAVAGVTAIETALAHKASPAQAAVRTLMLLAEHGAAVAWRISMDWPALLDNPPDIRVCANIRRAAAAINAVAEHGQWAHIGGARLRPDRDTLSRNISALARMLVDLFPEAADPTPTWSELERAITTGASTPARLIAASRAAAMADYGAHGQAQLASTDAEWFATRLMGDPGFSDAPTIDGTPAEVGPLAAQRHPLIADAIAHWGPTLATRLLAAALDAPAVARRITQALDGLTDDDPVEVDLMRSGHGAAVVETVRGPLAYCVEVADGRTTLLRNVAPTEWNFHTDGPFLNALAAAPRVRDPVFAARLLAASFDPCVPFHIELAPDRSPTRTEVALHA